MALKSQRNREKGKAALDYRDLIHTLNRRYKEAWDRAERIQATLDDIHHSRAWRVFSFLRQVKSWFQPAAALPPNLPHGYPSLEIGDVRATGRVSIVIPFRNQVGLLRNCLASLARTNYRRFEVLLVDNDSTEVRLLSLLERLEARRRIRVLRHPGPFHFAKICNGAAAQARGDFLLFLNNDIEVINADWLERMLEVANHPDVGVVGAALIYPDNTIQHAGLAPEENGTWRHLHRDQAVEVLSPLIHSVPAVTGACLLIRRSLFQELGGFDEKFPVTMNDVDLCLRVRELGLHVALTPHARLYHFESLSRGYAK